MQTQSPRIYNLFPRLLGPINRWTDHLDRIQKMGFNWIYINPINYPGFSGSLYSIKDYYRFNNMFLPEGSQDDYDWKPVKEFIVQCHKRNLKVMMDLVINHVAIDCPLIEEHPKWFMKKWALVDNLTHMPSRFFEGEQLPEFDPGLGSQYHLEYRLANPYAIDPADSRRVTIWGDLAELNYSSEVERNSICEYWNKYLDFCLDLGFDGFRCDAAYQVRCAVWKSLISHVRSIKSDSLFLAETLGCTLDQCAKTASAGFDYIHSSSKWWDFTKPWVVEQYMAYRGFAPSVSFPESHDTPRLSKETNGNRDLQIFRYFFASVFSAGILMPLGYEFGFKRKLDVVDMMPNEWEEPTFDITSEIAQINQFKQKYRVLNEDGPIRHFEYGDLGVLVFRKTSLDEKQHFFLIYNKDWNNWHHFYSPDLRYYLDLGTPITQIGINKESVNLTEFLLDKDLRPNEFLCFFQEK